MSSILDTAHPESVRALESNYRVAVIAARWNSDITDPLAEGAVNALLEAGVDYESIVSVRVPGTVELVNAARIAVRSRKVDAVIILGCVIRGDTPHFDYVCQIAAQGTAMLNASQDKPVIFGVLTVENHQQALDRAGGKLGNKGSEAAQAAVEMLNLHRGF